MYVRSRTPLEKKSELTEICDFRFWHSLRSVGRNLRRRDRQIRLDQALDKAIRCLWRIVSSFVSQTSSNWDLPDHPRIFNLSRDNANATLRCPIAPGTHTITQTVALPREIPRGESSYSYWSEKVVWCSRLTKFRFDANAAKFQVDALVYTQDEEPAACINLWSECTSLSVERRAKTDDSYLLQLTSSFPIFKKIKHLRPHCTPIWSIWASQRSFDIGRLPPSKQSCFVFCFLVSLFLLPLCLLTLILPQITRIALIPTRASCL